MNRLERFLWAFARAHGLKKRFGVAFRSAWHFATMPGLIHSMTRQITRDFDRSL